MSLKPTSKRKKLTRKQRLLERARKGIITKRAKRRIEELAKVKEVMQNGGTAIEVCQTLDCALGDANKLIATVNKIIKDSFMVRAPERGRPRDPEAGLAPDEIVERVSKRLEEIVKAADKALGKK